MSAPQGDAPQRGVQAMAAGDKEALAEAMADFNARPQAKQSATYTGPNAGQVGGKTTDVRTQDTQHLEGPKGPAGKQHP